MKFLFAALVLISSALSVAQETTYRFTTDPFEDADSPLAAGVVVEGFLTLSEPLPPNLENEPVDPLLVINYLIKVGEAQFTPENSVLTANEQSNPPITIPFRLSTDANGLPTAPFYIGAISPAPPHEMGDTISAVFVYDFSPQPFAPKEKSAALAVLCEFTSIYITGTDQKICQPTFGQYQAYDDDPNVTWTIDEPGTDSCDQFSGKLGGICNAYCKAQSCFDTPDKKSCQVLAHNFVKFGGSSSEPPCGPVLPDTDGDGVIDAEDNCPTTPNPDQADENMNGFGDACEPKQCPEEADCNGKQCGDDGCGGSCGSCGSDFTCNSAGLCE